jgi:hypothetical protein
VKTHSISSHAARLVRAAAIVAGLAYAAGAVAQETPAAQALPVARVVLFSSGVGYFQRDGEVDGDAQVELKFNVDDINDLLKSMVVQDFGGGNISTVTYGSQDPITRTLQTFSIDLTANPTLAQLLNQVRGEQVEIEAASEISGTILGVEPRRQPAGKDQAIDVDYLNLLTAKGLQSVPLASVTRIRLVNERLDAELRQALAVLALAHAADKKSVSLAFRGQGRRGVSVGYIQEAPIWKTSYRLVLDDERPPLLQGWAIVENTTEEDWNDVHLTLVSGRPISFVMNLYQPLYVPRPVVEPELFASLRPQTYGQDLEAAEEEFAKAAADDARMAGARRARQQEPGAPGGAGFGALGDRDKAAEYDSLAELVTSTVTPDAYSEEVGELFQYAIGTPVDLPRQQSAMLAIVNGSVEGSKVSIYNPAMHAKHPLNGLELTNTTGLHLMQGPITVFDGGAYAGDAQIEDLPPGTRRLISYALDLDTEVALAPKSEPEQLTRVWIARGTLHSTRKFVRSQTYTVKNSGSEAKRVLIEYPHEANWKLTAPAEPTETTRDLYRFAVSAEPGVPAELVVAEESMAEQQVAITNLDDGTIQFYISAKVVSQEVKDALAEVLRRKTAIGQAAAEQQRLEAQIAAIGQEQARIRENMAQLDRNSELYNRYVKKFSEQEDQIETIQAQVAELRTDLAGQQRELDEYLAGLDLT